jgi:hypothetical protein
MEQHLKIGDLASRSGCIVETVRFYEKEKLLPTPTRTAGACRTAFVYSTLPFAGYDVGGNSLFADVSGRP